MKATTTQSRVQMDIATKNNLVAEVKETIAFDLIKNEKTAIKSVDLYKMDKTRKLATRTFSGKRNVIPFM